MNPKIYCVGGCVRDVLLGRTPKDIDYVVCGATEQWMLDQGFQKIEATNFPVFLDSNRNEYALARTEKKSGHGYHGFEVNFEPTVTLEDDLSRRDLTINSMAVLKENWDEFVRTADLSFVVDPFNGVSDLKNQVLRHTSKAFKEDPVRVLRVARFASRYFFSVAPDTIELMRSLVASGELDHLVPERVYLEMIKALGEPQPSLFFLILDKVHALKVLFPEFERVPTPEIENADPFYRFACMCLVLDVDTINNLCDRLHAPISLKDLAVTTRILFNALHDVTTAEHLMNVFEILGGVRNVKLIQQVLDELLPEIFPLTRVQEKMRRFSAAAGAMAEIAFRDLTDEQQSTLKGAEIGQALRSMRIAQMVGILST